MEKYLEGTAITEDEIRAAIRKGDAGDDARPGALRLRVQEQRRAAAARRRRRLPAVAARRSAGQGRRIPTTRRSPSARRSDDAPFSALAFKIMTDPFVGTLTFFRVYSGVLTAGALRSTTRRRRARERIGRLLKMHANKREEIKEVYAGDIAAAVGLRSTTTGDTLCDEDKPIILESIEFPDPVIDVAIEPKTKDDQEKLGIALQKLATEDPSFRVADRQGDRPDDHLRHGRAPPRDHRRSLAARVQSRRQRRQAAGRLSRDDPQEGRAGRPIRPADRWSRPVRSRRGSRSSRCRRAADSSSRTAPRAAPIPKEFVPAVEKGIREAFEGGVLAGYPVVDVKATSDRRLVSRRRLVRDRVQDRRLDGGQGGRGEGQARSSSSRSWRSKSSCPKSSWATSWAT